jgi:hypothetical protein
MKAVFSVRPDKWGFLGLRLLDSLRVRCGCNPPRHPLEHGKGTHESTHENPRPAQKRAAHRGALLRVTDAPILEAWAASFGIVVILANVPNQGFAVPFGIKTEMSVNRAAARAYAAEKRRRFEEERDRAADLEALRVLRDYLIFKAKNRGYACDRLKIAIDDYAEELTGDRTALHAKPASTGR